MRAPESSSWRMLLVWMASSEAIFVLAVEEGVGDCVESLERAGTVGAVAVEEAMLRGVR